MRILNRYLLSQHAVPFVFALSATTGIMLLNQVAKRFGDLVGKGLPWTVIVEVFALSVPFIVAMTLPMAVLVAVLYAFSRLSADSELTAIRANGISLGQMLRPLLLGALVVSVAAFGFSDHVLPRSNHRLRTLLMDINRKKPTFALKEQVINEVRPAVFFLRAGRIDQATFRLLDVTIYDLADQERGRVVYADSGYMAFSEDQENLHLTLHDGVVHEFSRYDSRVFQQMAFRREVIRVRGVGNELSRTENDTYRGDREMGSCEMRDVIASARRERGVAERSAAAVQASDLRALVGLGPLAADTALAEDARPVYCRALKVLGSWTLPARLQAQQQGGRPRPPNLGQDIMRNLNQPARQALITGTMPPPRWGEIRSLRDRARGAAYREAIYQVELHKKLAIACAAIAFVLIGVPAALRFPRGGVGLVIGLSMTVFTIYYVGLIAGEALANRLIVPPEIMWAPNAIFATVGLLLLWRTRYEAAPRRRVRPAGGGEA